MLGLLGHGRFKSWDEYQQHQAFTKGERFDMELDKIPFISAHLNPDNSSPAHVKDYWTKRPGLNHPMLADYLVVQHLDYYSFRRPTQHSGPLTLPSQADARGEYQSDPRSTHSSPPGSPRGNRRVDSAHSEPGAAPDGNGGPDHPRSPKPSNKGVPAPLSTAKRAALSGAVGLVVGGGIVAAVLGRNAGSSDASGEDPR